MTDVQFPKQVATYTLDYVYMGTISSKASYVDPVSVRAISSLVTSGVGIYKRDVALLEEPEYVGRAVCGHPRTEPTFVICLMVGTKHVLSVQTASEAPIADVAAFTEAFYDLI